VTTEKKVDQWDEECRRAAPFARTGARGAFRGAWQADGVDDDLDTLVGDWLPLPDVAERIGLDVGKVRRLLQDRDLVAVRRGERNVLSVPAALIADGAPMPELRGTLTVLADSGYDDEAAVRWLFTPDDSLPGTPVDARRAGRKRQVRRLAQALAF
jgi:hypothetical protein